MGACLSGNYVDAFKQEFFKEFKEEVINDVVTRIERSQACSPRTTAD